jgi:hypothetical protein
MKATNASLVLLLPLLLMISYGRVLMSMVGIRSKLKVLGHHGSKATTTDHFNESQNILGDARRGRTSHGRADDESPSSRQSVDTKDDVTHSVDIDIFLNAYFPSLSKEETESTTSPIQPAMMIVTEQIQQIGNNYAGTQNVTVHVTTVGVNGLNSSLLDDICYNTTNGRVKCVLSPHIEEGGELDTLSELYSFCQKAEDSSRAVYMHNKGSFNPGRGNDRWRRAMTDAVTDERCLKPPNETCNLCGLQFAAPPKMFTLLMPGNFFAASCKYIRGLLPPKSFGKELNKLSKTKMMRKFQYSIFKRKLWVVGTGRYAAEHWIASHPSVMPCDLSVQEDYWYWQNHGHSKDEFQWSMWPRPGANRSEQTKLPAALDGNPDLRLREYGLLASQLYRWINLYNSTPSESSWIWSNFPDGLFWKDALRKHGDGVANVVTDSNFDRNQSFSEFVASLQQSEKQILYGP